MGAASKKMVGGKKYWGGHFPMQFIIYSKGLSAWPSSSNLFSSLKTSSFQVLLCGS